MKYTIVFLDIDGVLNSHKFLCRNQHLKPEQKRNIDERKVLLLKQIVDRTDAKLVLSSSWRVDFDKALMPLTEEAEEIVEELNKKGLVLWDKTEGTLSKPDSIINWLAEHNEVVQAYVVIDDDQSVRREEYADKFVKTSFFAGVTDRAVRETIDKLNAAKGKEL